VFAFPSFSPSYFHGGYLFCREIFLPAFDLLRSENFFLLPTQLLLICGTGFDRLSLLPRQPLSKHSCRSDPGSPFYFELRSNGGSIDSTPFCSPHPIRHEGSATLSLSCHEIDLLPETFEGSVLLSGAFGRKDYVLPDLSWFFVTTRSSFAFNTVAEPPGPLFPFFFSFRSLWRTSPPVPKHLLER